MVSSNCASRTLWLVENPTIQWWMGTNWAEHGAGAWRSESRRSFHLGGCVADHSSGSISMPAAIKVFVAVVAVFVACMHAVEARVMADTAGVCSSDVLTKSAENTKDCFPDEAAFCANYRCVNAFVAISQSSDFGCRLPDGFTSSTVKDNATAMLKKCTEEQKKEAVEKANATNEDQQLSLPDGAMTLKQCSVSVALAALVAMAVMQL